ncbi:MAG TPA: MFS transporter [Bacteroidetes bacterium]|nr:MFS transporter [Bacteroidota bacterium]
MNNDSNRRMWMTVLVSGLGYFVDIYDLILFSIVRPESLKAIGLTTQAEIIGASEIILNAQMIGMLIGGIIFGLLADKRGRLSVLMGSILMYSLMNIANAFVSSVEMYAVFRFFSGIGLAGELGVAVTLVSEVMPIRTRGYGTTIVASMGILGAVGAYAVHQFTDWRTAFVVGGLMGLALLALRVQVHESGMFRRLEDKPVSRGNLSMLFTRRRLPAYLSSVAIGLPIWYVIGILVTFAPEFTLESGGSADVVAGQAVMWCYVGLAAGDLVSGLISQLLKSRRRTVLVFLVLTVAAVAWYLTTPGRSAGMTYLQTGLLGFAVGYWAVFVTTAAEQFGTNLRATVATTVPNLVRGALFPAMIAFTTLRQGSAHIISGQPLISSAIVVGTIALVVAFIGLMTMKETYGKDLDYVEEYHIG